MPRGSTWTPHVRRGRGSRGGRAGGTAAASGAARAGNSKCKVQTIDLTEDDETQPRAAKAPRNDSSSQKPASSSSSRGEWRRPSESESLAHPAPTSSDNRSSARDSSQNQVDTAATNGHAFVPNSQDERESWLVPSTQERSDERDIYETIASSQDVTVGNEDYVKYSEIPTKIVGVRFYQGWANFGEHIELLREPGNPYDSNAIRLAKYLDNGWLAIAAVISGTIGDFDCPIIMNVFGPPLNDPESAEIRSQMKKDRLPLQHINLLEKHEKARQTSERKRAAKSAIEATKDPTWKGSQNAGDGSQQQNIEDIIDSSERFDSRNIKDASEDFGNTEDDLAAMPMAQQPERIETKMLPYQLQALAWLRDREDPRLPTANSKPPHDVVQLWRRHDSVASAYTNIATNFSVKDREPKLASGGILADDMGLGKTLEMISLMASDEQDPDEALPTLIVAPLSVMSTWKDQIDRHMKKDQSLRVCIYHGSARKKMKTADFKKHDVIITTYPTLVFDWSSPSNPTPRSDTLYSLEWRRIILDEGHIVRNPQSKGAGAVNDLKAKSRWVLTGTPIVNSLRDLYTLVRFIGLSGGLEKLSLYGPMC
ncbi:hypothetical protein AAFC00_000507 [Neodothiora populina]|uniref:Helicase ATP-binding domain-containing protein n=1 Tax=Neodothiora populina TaxID=2781224 RepID=A0ABR3PDC9_9PEZI